MRASQAAPIGRPIAGAPEPLDIHKAFQQLDGVLVEVLPVRADLPGDPPQEVTGQMAHVDPRQNQIARVVGDLVKIVAVRLLGGAHELVAPVELPESARQALAMASDAM